ncbi:1,4-dihydroxy-6-naphthoate synthase [Parapedobacter composti]|uniref:1,4-dihydroxy-6-naphtoate synthase n=1 Tax=Parapedobacter composti TaxID=623281 RepID=A0A1I1IJ26_9SPHI|nr:1,4-dihydroxy-6-naphthoate synthase [Parapedobacter composti]SFC36284.1 1,4-dihydroxy-6-naphthoate synthase [Parapedobacter composti]
MKLSLGFSPCPNDTFIFDAFIHGKVDTEGLDVEVYYEDVETLNQRAFRGELDITKLSYHAYAYAVEAYVLLDAGSALGFGVGPLLICKRPELVELVGGDGGAVIGGRGSGVGDRGSVVGDRWSVIGDRGSVIGGELRVGIPGRYTTANFLLGLAFPQLKNKTELLFSDIEQALLDGQIDLGLIIHENRFTYQDKGLHKVIDLGDYWEKMAEAPIPLGGIVVKRELPDDIKRKINRVIRRSVEFALANPESGLEFIRFHAQAMSEAVMYKHIELYVNRFSVSLGDEGRRAVQILFDRARALNLIPQTSKQLFLTA